MGVRTLIHPTGVGKSKKVNISDSEVGKNLDFSDLEITTLEELDEKDDVYSKGLCVPMDRLEDLDFFPNFSNDLISLTQLLPEDDEFSLSSDYIGSRRKTKKDLLKGHLSSEIIESRQRIKQLSSHEILFDQKQFGILHDKLELRPSLIEEKVYDRQKNFLEEFSDEGDVYQSSYMYIKTPKNYEECSKKRKNEDDDVIDIGDGEISCIFKKPRSKKVRKNSSMKSFRTFSNPKNMKRRCSHCQAEKTPQWRMGPNGPNTLCNACGVRNATGRLLPEYRPAASPSFDSNKHSNFHKMIIQKKKKSCIMDDSALVNR